MSLIPLSLSDLQNNIKNQKYPAGRFLATNPEYASGMGWYDLNDYLNLLNIGSNPISNSNTNIDCGTFTSNFNLSIDCGGF